MIELNNKDGINEFLELDDDLFIEVSKIFYETYNSIYIIQYPNFDIAKVFYGLLKEFE